MRSLAPLAFRPERLLVAVFRVGFGTGVPDTIAASARTAPVTNIVTLSHQLAFKRFA